MRYVKRFILTGAPGSGKTTLLRQLEVDGFVVVEEAATDIIALSQAQGVAEPWTRPSFIDAVVGLQRRREYLAASIPAFAESHVQFHDRSVFCTAALADYLGFPRPPLLRQELARVEAENVFERSVFFVRNLGFVTPTEARRISYEEAVRFEEIHERIYRDHGFKLVYIEPASLQQRVTAVTNAIHL
jgi:predicted ATPase